MIKRLLVTPGEPAGIGPDLCMNLMDWDFDQYEVAVIADPAILQARAEVLKIPINIKEIELDTPVTPFIKGTIKVIPLPAQTKSEPGKPDIENSHYLLASLDIAVDACQRGDAVAMITGPINKATINESGIAFTGHTEYLQKRCKTEQVVMMLATESLKVALATTHMPLRDVADAITPKRLNLVLEVLTKSMKQDFGYENARVLVAGLNPHAGEMGYLGREEIDCIQPVIEEWQKNGFDLVGPLPADTMYAKYWLDQADATLAMYHDQGLPVLKHSGFGKAVNITLGLPIIRTSVDHGTAFDLAGTGNCDSGSFWHAIQFAAQMASNRIQTTNDNSIG